MKKLIKILPLIILIILSILSMKGKLVLGLGDIVFHGLIHIGLIIYGIYLIVKKEKQQSVNLVFPILSIGFCGYLILSMTIWRGVEYRWNGHILYPKHKQELSK